MRDVGLRRCSAGDRKVFMGVDDLACNTSEAAKVMLAVPQDQLLGTKCVAAYIVAHFKPEALTWTTQVLINDIRSSRVLANSAAEHGSLRRGHE